MDDGRTHSRASQLEGLESKEIRLTLNTSEEALVLGVYDGEWVTWRSLSSKVDPSCDTGVRQVALSGSMLGHLTRIISPLGDVAIDFEFTTGLGLARFHVDDRIAGVLMPVRTTATVAADQERREAAQPPTY